MIQVSEVNWIPKNSKCSVGTVFRKAYFPETEQTLLAQLSECIARV